MALERALSGAPPLKNSEAYAQLIPLPFTPCSPPPPPFGEEAWRPAKGTYEPSHIVRRGDQGVKWTFKGRDLFNGKGHD